MSRRHAAEKREILPDVRFGNQTVAKFINCVMERGKKTVAEGIVYGALEIAEKKLKKNSIEIFEEVIKAVSPAIEVRSRRVGGATYQVPVEVRSVRSTALSIRWIIIAAAKRSEKTMRDRLAAEFMDAVNGRGAAVKKREDTHKMADANKAFSHFRW
jgi:small subunit ribosomal protein S7